MHGLYAVGVVLYWIIVTVAIVHVVMDNRQPAKTMAWALVIFFVPIVGIVFYLFFGINTRKQRMVSQRSLDQLSKRSMLEFVEQRSLHLPDDHKPLIDLYVNQNFSLPFKVDDIQLLCDGKDFFPALFKAIGEARDHIHLDFYIIEDDPLGRLISDMLIDRAREGVEVRLIYDDVGCWNVRHRFFERMREEGIEVVPFLPVRFPSFANKVNYRNHRKICVIDGRVGFIGGMNLALRYWQGTETQSWRDTMIRVEGSVVYALQRAFLIDWYFVDRTLISHRKYYPPSTPPSFGGDGGGSPIAQIVTSSPASPYPEIMQGYVHVISTAKKSILMETSYVEGENRFFEFLIPQKDNVKGFVELSLTIPYYYKNRNIPVEARPFKLIADTSSVSEVDLSSEAHNTVHNKFSQLKINCAQMPLDSSSTRFTLNVK